MATNPSSPSEHTHARDPISELRGEHFLSAADLARAFSTKRTRWTVRRARRFLRKSGCGFQMFAGGPWVTTWEAIRDRMPALFAQLLIITDEAGNTTCRWCGSAIDID